MNDKFSLIISMMLSLTCCTVLLLRFRRLRVGRNRLESKFQEHRQELHGKLLEANENMARLNRRLGSASEDLLSVLDLLKSGVIMTDPAGCVTFLSLSALRLFDHIEEKVLGQRWEQLFPFREEDKAQLKSLSLLPPAQRSKYPVRVEAGGGRQYRMEVEVQDDPRDGRCKIFFLHDISEVYEFHHLLDQRTKFHDLIGECAAMKMIYKQIHDVARMESTVLIEGETGTGKELAARAIHRSSPRKDKPFIAVNCAGLTESLLASQLFGHKRGSFTGAVADHVGLFEAANGGTILLDEIGDIPMSVQNSLLRVLQEKEITRLGESTPRKIDARVIAATHRDLNRAVAEGNFRQDLLYRIRIGQIRLPALRQRLEDLPLLVAWFLGQLRAASGKSSQDLSSETMRALLQYSWPGNVRELKSAIECAVIHCQGEVIQPCDLPAHVLGGVRPFQPANGYSQGEKQRLLEALECAGGNRAAAARNLGIGRTTLYRRMKELEIA